MATNAAPAKTVTIYVNGREKETEQRELTFWDLVNLAFDNNPQPGPNIFFTISYRKGDDKKPKGTVVDGDTLKVKDGMEINVTRTDKS